MEQQVVVARRSTGTAPTLADSATMSTRLAGTGIWSGMLRYGDPGQIAAAATELEALGYSALWIPDVGGDLFGPLASLLAATTTATIATGILNVWMHTPEETAREHTRLTAEHGPRFLCGIGISHRPFIDHVKSSGAAAARGKER